MCDLMGHSQVIQFVAPGLFQLAVPHARPYPARTGDRVLES
jgi:hypothetical protein